MGGREERREEGEKKTPFLSSRIRSEVRTGGRGTFERGGVCLRAGARQKMRTLVMLVIGGIGGAALAENKELVSGKPWGCCARVCACPRFALGALRRLRRGCCCRSGAPRSAFLRPCLMCRGCRLRAAVAPARRVQVGDWLYDAGAFLKSFAQQLETVELSGLTCPQRAVCPERVYASCGAGRARPAPRCGQLTLSTLAP